MPVLGAPSEPFEAVHFVGVGPDDPAATTDRQLAGMNPDPTDSTVKRRVRQIKVAGEVDKPPFMVGQFVFLRGYRTLGASTMMPDQFDEPLVH